MWWRSLRVLAVTVLALAVAYVGFGLLAMTRPERFPPGAPVMTTHWETTATLTRAAPVAVRAVHVEVERNEGPCS